jgi:hypothetical protein
MNEFYKEKYQQFVDSLNKDLKAGGHKSLSQMSKSEIEHNLRLFIDHMFGADLLNQFSDSEQQQIVQSMMIFVFAHRHSKGDKFIFETQEVMKTSTMKDLHFDFTIVRNVMYLYSKKA